MSITRIGLSWAQMTKHSIQKQQAKMLGRDCCIHLQLQRLLCILLKHDPPQQHLFCRL